MKAFADVTSLIAAANAVRGYGDEPAPAASGADADHLLDARFGTSSTLAVYGSLAPGKQNHHIVAPLGGEWSQGFVHGDLAPHGWGAPLGYPAFRPRADGPAVPVHLLRSPALPRAWSMLDEFEGAEYIRILVPVFATTAEVTGWPTAVANLYAASPLSKH